nr:ABC transporter ATP-binding protein [Actinomycetota bacterium]
AQRVAVARTLAGDPGLILADEPTGQLDAANGAAVIAVLLQASQRSGAGLVISTHDQAVADAVPIRWEIHNGELAVRDPETAWSR